MSNLNSLLYTTVCSKCGDTFEFELSKKGYLYKTCPNCRIDRVKVIKDSFTYTKSSIGLRISSGFNLMNKCERW